MRFITADVIFTGKENELKDHVIVIDSEGFIKDILPQASIEDKTKIEIYEGGLTPGFVNSHCHLELSHMKGLVDTGTSLLPFLKKVVQFRNFPQEEIDQAIIDGNQEMINNGIVACGDISNKVDTAEVKSKSDILYYTFVEMFDFMQPFLTQSTIENYKEVFDKQSDINGNRKSFVPHSPYTVGTDIFKYINQNNSETATVSIHNQETVEENLLFEKGTGNFLDFYKDFGFDFSSFSPINKSSIHYAMDNMDSNLKTLFVHNTTTNTEDIKASSAWSDKVYWATCPNANLYIENKLPNYQLFLDENARMTIGTDSLTSNWQLNVASEMLAIQKYASYVPLTTLVQWATKNGAEALGFDANIGTIETGKKPGINLIDVTLINDKWRMNSDLVKKLA